MKALSLRQPWCWAILGAGKRIENRQWNTHYRGPILLHAAKGCTDREMRDGLQWMTDAGVVQRAVWADGPLLDMRRGGIVGRARLVDVIPACRANGRAVELAHMVARVHHVDLRWWMPEQYGFVLADVEPLPFTPHPGALNLFNVPDDVAARAQRAA
jgi:hypothetical protein